MRNVPGEQRGAQSMQTDLDGDRVAVVDLHLGLFGILAFSLLRSRGGRHRGRFVTGRSEKSLLVLLRCAVAAFPSVSAPILVLDPEIVANESQLHQHEAEKGALAIAAWGEAQERARRRRSEQSDGAGRGSAW